MSLLSAPSAVGIYSFARISFLALWVSAAGTGLAGSIFARAFLLVFAFAFALVFALSFAFAA
jgi:hypothetical protein